MERKSIADTMKKRMKGQSASVQKIVLEALTCIVNPGLPFSIEGDCALSIDMPADFSAIFTVIEHACAFVYT